MRTTGTMRPGPVILTYERLDDGLALGVAACLKDADDVVGDLQQGGGWRRGRCGGDLTGELIPSGAQLA